MPLVPRTGPVTIFMCRRRTDGPSCTEAGCHEHAAAACTFALGGKKQGQVCGRKLCGKHGSISPLCSPHQRFEAARAAR